MQRTFRLPGVTTAFGVVIFIFSAAIIVAADGQRPMLSLDVSVVDGVVSIIIIILLVDGETVHASNGRGGCHQAGG